MTQKTITEFPLRRHYFCSEPCYFDNLHASSGRKNSFNSHALILQNLHNTLSPVHVYLEQFGMNWHLSNGKSRIIEKPKPSYHGEEHYCPPRLEKKKFQKHSHSKIQTLKRFKTHGGIILNIPRCVFPENHFHKVSRPEFIKSDVDTKRTLNLPKSKTAQLVPKRMSACTSVALRPNKDRNNASKKRLFSNGSNIYGTRCEKSIRPSCRVQHIAGIVDSHQQSISRQIQTDCSSDHEGSF